MKGVSAKPNKITSIKLNNLINCVFVSNSVIPPKHLIITTISITDTGCSGHYNGDMQGGTPTRTPINVQLPNGGTMTSTHTCHIHTPSLLPKACQHYLILAMKTTNLLSIGQLCNHGCTAQFSKR